MKIPGNKPAWATHWVRQARTEDVGWWLSETLIQAADLDGSVYRGHKPEEHSQFDSYVAGKWNCTVYPVKPLIMENK